MFHRRPLILPFFLQPFLRPLRAGPSFDSAVGGRWISPGLRSLFRPHFRPVRNITIVDGSHVSTTCKRFHIMQIATCSPRVNAFIFWQYPRVNHVDIFTSTFSSANLHLMTWYVMKKPGIRKPSPGLGSRATPPWREEEQPRKMRKVNENKKDTRRPFSVSPVIR